MDEGRRAPRYESGEQGAYYEAPPAPRQFLPTLSDLVDRLTIVLQKMIFIHERRSEYEAEEADLLHDIDQILGGASKRLDAKDIRAIAIMMLANRFIWENESKIRDGTDTDERSQLQRLKATHSINGVRNTAKNVLAASFGGRKDYKIDSLSADLLKEFGNWDIFRVEPAPSTATREASKTNGEARGEAVPRQVAPY
jgi:hypothetical protein